MRIHIETNFKSFKQGLITAQAVMKKATKEGMTRAVLKYMDDCLHIPPTCPRDTGSMAASHSALVDGKAVGTSEHEPHSGGTGATPLRYLPKISSHLEGAVVVHKKYAAAQHEGIAGGHSVKRYTTPGSGPKWVESKLVAFKHTYYSMIATRLRELK